MYTHEILYSMPVRAIHSFTINAHCNIIIRLPYRKPRSFAILAFILAVVWLN